MEQAIEFIHLTRFDRRLNMARFYTLSVEPTLFGGMALCRTWGRIGTWGKSRIDLFDDAESAHRFGQRLLGQKTNKGYRLTSPQPSLSSANQS